MRELAGIALVAIVLAAGARPAAAQNEKGTFGAGLILGEPTGLSVKLYLGDDTAIDGAAGGSVTGRGLQIHGDFLWHPIQLASEESFVLPAYFGVGLRILDHDRGDGVARDYHLGVRGVVGMVFDFRTVPIDVFVEVCLVGDYKTASDDHGGLGLDVNAGAGVRYYF